MSSEKSTLARFFGGIWRFIDGTRKLVLNLVFFFFFFLLLAALFDTGEALVIKPQTALVLRPAGDVVEQYSGTPLDRALQQATTQSGRTETRLRDMIAVIERARDDDRITRLVIDTSQMWRIGLASLHELDTAIDEFRGSGKPVLALADNLAQQHYLMAALADEVWLNPNGMVWIDGFAAWRQFYAEGLEKLEVEVNLFRAGEYKSAMEPYIRNDMSPEAREANLYWIGDLWDQYLETVSRRRGVPKENLAQAINQFADRLEAVEGDFARFALDAGLVDQLVTRPEAQAALARMGAAGSGSEGFRQVSMEDYLALTQFETLPSGSASVKVVVAEGEIVRGQQPQGIVGADTLVSRLRAVARQNHVEAVVLRVNSPGGELFASEKIRRELEALNALGKTVVVSMGDVAASGGYWISMAADEVWANPSTITGSIGVYGILPTISRPLEKLGIHNDGVGTTPLAGKMRIDRPLDPQIRRILEMSTEKGYRDFLEVVSSARGMDVREVDEVARGRVWSGNQARSRGLVDHLGGLGQAIESAARLAGIEGDYAVEYDEPDLTTFEMFLVDMTGTVMSWVGLGKQSRDLALLRTTLFDDLLTDLARLARNADGFSVAAHCLCRVDG